jgi:hypothetical protein
MPTAPKLRPFGPMPTVDAGASGISPRASEYAGPVVRVTRGKNTTAVPVGGK